MMDSHRPPHARRFDISWNGREGAPGADWVGGDRHQDSAHAVVGSPSGTVLSWIALGPFLWFGPSTQCRRVQTRRCMASLAEELLGDFGEDFSDLLHATPEDPSRESIACVSGSAIATDGSLPAQVVESQEFLRSPFCVRFVDKANSLLASMEGDQTGESTHDIKYLLDDEENTPIESSPLYKLVAEANTFLNRLDESFLQVYAFVFDTYSLRFKELGNVVPDPQDYVKVVEALGRGIRVNSTNEATLKGLLSPSQYLTFTVALTGVVEDHTKLPRAAMDAVLDACATCTHILRLRFVTIQYIGLFMNQLGPNLSALVGIEIAANLCALTGGMIALSRVPGCNVIVIGKKRSVLHGYSKVAELQHVGIIAMSPIIQQCPKEHQKKMSKILASKITLATRIDCARGSRDGSMGLEYKRHCDEKLAQWTAPNKAKSHKPLPIPCEIKSKKRGGKRYRKAKEKYGLTDVHRERQRMKFGESGNGDEYGDSAMGLTNGTLGQRGSGRMRNVNPAPKAGGETQNGLWAATVKPSGNGDKHGYFENP
jgi:RNA processing factor Prp31